MPQPSGSPAAPPAAKKSSLKNASQTCPLQKKGACVLRTFKVTVTPGIPDPKYPKRILETDRVKRGDKTTIENREVIDLLARYDMVIDTFAASPTRETPHPTAKASIIGEVVTEGMCSTNQHPTVSLDPKTPAEGIPAGGETWKSTSSMSRSVTSPPVLWDTTQKTSPVGFMMSLLSNIFGPQSTQIEMAGKGCAARYPNGVLVNEDATLNCLVRVFRQDDYKIQFVWASAYGKGTAKSGTTTGFGGAKTTTTSTSTTKKVGGTTTVNTKSTSSPQTQSLLNPATETSSTSVTKVGADNSYKTSQVNHGADISTSSGSGLVASGSQREMAVTKNGERPPYPKDGAGNEIPPLPGEEWQRRTSPPRWERTVAPAGAPPPQLTLVVVRNGQSLDLVDAQRNFFAALKTVLDGIERFAALLRKAPQIGWSFSYSFSALDGRIEGEAKRIHLAKEENDRYFPVGWDGSLNFALTVFSFSATASFGAKLDLGRVANAEASVSGTLGAIITLGGTVALQGESSLNLTPTVTALIKGVVKASALGVDLFEVSVTLSGGLTILDQSVNPPVPGGLTYKKGKGFGWAGDLVSTPIVLTFVNQHVGGGPGTTAYTVVGPQTIINFTARKN